MRNNSSQSQLPQAEEFLPSWTTMRFVVLDESRRWAASVHRELSQQTRSIIGLADCVTAFEACERAREVLLCCELRNTVGVILFAESLERECLSVLGGLLRRNASLPVLVLCEEHHSGLVPLLLEAGACGVMFGVRNDIRVSDWCVRVLQQRVER